MRSKNKKCNLGHCTSASLRHVFSCFKIRKQLTRLFFFTVLLRFSPAPVGGGFSSPSWVSSWFLILCLKERLKKVDKRLFVPASLNLWAYGWKALKTRLFCPAEQKARLLSRHEISHKRWRNVKWKHSLPSRRLNRRKDYRYSPTFHPELNPPPLKIKRNKRQVYVGTKFLMNTKLYSSDVLPLRRSY